MMGLIERIERLREFERLLVSVEKERFLHVGMVFGVAEAAVVAALSQRTRRKTLLVSADIERQKEHFEDFEALGKDVLFFPQLLENVERKVNAVLLRDRYRLLERIKAEESDTVVATARSLLQPVPSPELLRMKMLTIRTGETVEQEKLVAILKEAGYEGVDFTYTPGEFAQRGGIIDVYPFNSSAPYRIEFFGDEIETIRIFDERTQRTERIIRSAEIMLHSRETDETSSLLDYISEGLFIIKGGESASSDYGDLLMEAERRSLKTLLFTPTPSTSDEHGVDFPFLPARVVGADAESVISYVNNCIKHHRDVFIFCPTEGDRERFEELCGEYSLPLRRISIEIGTISGGFIAEGEFAVLSYIQMFGKKRLPYEREPETPVSTPYTEMEVGDLCVHTDYGICKFCGIERLKTEGAEEEMLSFEFADGAKLYLSPLQVDKVHRYIGAGRLKPSLSRLDDKKWLRRKKRVEKAVGELARRLLTVQAKRMLHKGIAFPPDSSLQKEFEDAFPYVETEDQRRSAEAVKRAMMQSRPMDYLLAGDVGYGKTEVAMRAAFKAVEFGKQVAVLVPTTLLAEQHYRTFLQRMADYPIIVEMLSRFKKPSEQVEIIKRLADGRIDIVIGTHRLLSGDVKFHSLGLLIIDEEQRFGVEQKEHFKRLRTTIDVLSLTATPIPRTLNMALSGIKDMSVLATPPPQKLPIITKVARYNRRLIREAIVREIMRNGQVFFVHNRIKGIETVCAELEELVPEARFTIAHGRMDESRLAETMRHFLDRKIDVLVTTTIIESGLDIPTVNTLIVNNAHTFGLADLHQLRGRVGRHAEQAFAYFLVPSFKRINYTARQRLLAIEEFSRLGAGFQIALRDLEIRGAGNLLGKEQSGLIHAVGYDLYIRLLSHTIAELRGQPQKERFITEIDIPLEGYIPSDYIKDLRKKIEFYREIASAENAETLKTTEEKMKDIFGRPPPPVQNFLLKSELSVLLKKYGIDFVSLRKEGLMMRYRSPSDIKPLLKRKEFWLAGERLLYMYLPDNLRSDPLKTIRFLIRKFSRL